MKKSVSFLLALVLACSLAACDSLSLKPSEGPTSKTGYVGDTLSTNWFDFTVEDVYSCSEYDGYTAREGYQLVVATMTMKNTFGRSVDMWETDFPILWGEETDCIDIPVAVYSEDQLPEEYTLGINASKTGLLIYEVPEEYRDFAIWFQELYADEENPENEDGIEGDSFFVSFTAEKK